MPRGCTLMGWALLYNAFLAAGVDICTLCNCLEQNGLWYVNCSGKSLTEIPTPIPKATVCMNLSGNNIQAIPLNAFALTNRMRELDLSFNAIKRVDSNSFSGLVELQTLNLEGNRIAYDVTGFSASSLYHLKNLTKLNIFTQSCPSAMPDYLFYGLDNVQELFITLATNSTFGDGFLGLRKLDTLHVSSANACPVGGVSQIRKHDLMALEKLPIRRLSFRNARLVAIEPEALQMFSATLRKLDVSCNNLLNLPAIIAGLSGAQITTLLADRAINKYMLLEINSTTLTAWQSMNLTVLSIAGNGNLLFGLGHYTPHYSLPELRYLRFGYNQVILETTDILPEVLLLGLLIFRHLGVLDISGIFNFYGDSNAKNFYIDCSTQDPLFSDEIQDWEEDKLTFLPSNETDAVWLLHAVLRFLEHSEVTLPPRLTRIYMENAGWKTKGMYCDISRTVWVENNLQRIVLSGTSVPLIDCTTAGFSQVTTIEAARMDITTFNSDLLSSSTMPQLRSLNLQGNELGTLFANTDALNDSHLLEYLDLSFNNIYSLPYTFLAGSTSIVTVNLSHNILLNWNSSIQFSKTLKLVDLSYNKLRGLTKTSCEEFDGQLSHVPNFTVLLNANEFVCSCENAEFLVWLLHTNVLHGARNCVDDSTVRVIDRFLLRDLHWRCELLFIFIGLLSVACAAVLALVICQVFKWRLKYAYYRLRQCMWPTTSGVNVGDAGVYVSHSGFDADNVRAAWDFLKDGMKVGRVVSRDDFDPGCYIHDQISQSIDACDVVVVLYAHGDFDDREFEFELNIALAKDVAGILPIVTTESLPIETMPRALKKLLCMNNLLTWPEPGERAWNEFSILFRKCTENIAKRAEMRRRKTAALRTRRRSIGLAGGNDLVHSENEEGESFPGDSLLR